MGTPKTLGSPQHPEMLGDPPMGTAETLEVGAPCPFPQHLEAVATPSEPRYLGDPWDPQHSLGQVPDQHPPPLCFLLWGVMHPQMERSGILPPPPPLGCPAPTGARLGWVVEITGSPGTELLPGISWGRESGESCPGFREGPPLQLSPPPLPQCPGA